MIRVGIRVQFKETGFPQLDGQKGVVERFQFSHWIVRLDNKIPGFYSGTAWADENELEIIE